MRALMIKISEVRAEIERMEQRPGRRTGADRAMIAERSIYLSGLEDALKIVTTEETA